MRRAGQGRLVVLFILFYCILQAVFYACRGTAIERFVIDDATVAPAARLIRIMDPGTHALAQGNRILSPQGGLVVQGGCEGTEALFLAWAAVAAYPARRRARVLGLLGSTALIYVLNQLRLAALFFASLHSQPMFGALHGYVAPTVIVVAAAIAFLWWAAWSARDDGNPSRA